jgi:pimeloyl-ACP methyl ester carboxylesterase
VTLDGIHVDCRGDGPPAVVFSHGFASSSETWAAQVEALSADHRVVRWDLRGHGHSPAPPGDYSREDGLADLAGVVDLATEGTGPAVLVGHSLGGYLSLFHTLTHPKTVAALVLISTGPGFKNDEKRQSYNRLMERVAARNDVPLSVAEVVRQKDGFVMEHLAEISCPTLVVTGADDHEMYRAGSAYIATRIPGASMVEIAGAGHDPHVDRAEEVTAAIRRLTGS